jgi:hypothetical protein
MQLDDNDNNDNDDSDEDGSEGAGAPPEDEGAESRENWLLHGSVCTNDNYGLGAFVKLLDPVPRLRQCLALLSSKL